MTKRTYIYIGILSILILTYIFSYTIDTSCNENTEKRNLFPDFNGSEAFMIEIDNQYGTITFVRRNDEWGLLLDGHIFPARTSRVVSIVDLLEELTIVRAVSSHSNSLESLGFTEDNQKNLTVFDSEHKVLASLIVGSSSDIEPGDFVMREDAGKAVLTNFSLNDLIDRDRLYWSKLRAFPSDLGDGDIVGCRIFASEPIELNLTLIRFTDSGRGEWRIHQVQSELDTTAVKKLISSIVNLEGEDFVTAAVNSPDEAHDSGDENPDRSSVFSPDVTIELLSSDGRELVYNLTIEEEGSTFHGMLNDSNYRLRMDPYTVAGILVSAEELLP